MKHQKTLNAGYTFSLWLQCLLTGLSTQKEENTAWSGARDEQR